MAPTLETPRLILRPWRPADVEPWVAMSADPRVRCSGHPLRPHVLYRLGR